MNLGLRHSDAAPTIPCSFVEEPTAVNVLGPIRVPLRQHGRYPYWPITEARERASSAEATDEIARHEGKRPRGWLGPWISESDVTPDLLKETGYDYVLDWCHDDRPVALATRAGPLLSVPYPQEANDANAIVVRRMTAEDFADLIVDQFDEMLDQASGSSLVCPISLHPHVSGQPHRLRH